MIGFTGTAQPNAFNVIIIITVANVFAAYCLASFRNQVFSVSNTRALHGFYCKKLIQDLWARANTQNAH